MFTQGETDEDDLTEKQTQMSHFANERRNNWSTSHYANKQAITINKVLAAIKKRDLSGRSHLTLHFTSIRCISQSQTQQQQKHQRKDFFSA